VILVLHQTLQRFVLLIAYLKKRIQDLVNETIASPHARHELVPHYALCA
jgi:hypothetical protein